MNRIFTLVCSIIVAAQFSTASAQTLMQIWKGGKVVATYETTAVDSVNFVTKPYTLVDLGLPSGLLWSNTNVGAAVPGDTGDYYAWGEIVTKTDYSTETSIWYGRDYTKGTELTPDDDVASVVCGMQYCMPSPEEFGEMIKYCDVNWTTQKNSKGEDQSGFLFTGPNGNSIFLPASGYYWGTQFLYLGSSGDYWTRVPDVSQNFDKNNIYTISGNPATGDYLRSNGYCVRPVMRR